MNTTLDKIRGIGKDSLTLYVFNTAGFRTFESLLRFKEHVLFFTDYSTFFQHVYSLFLTELNNQYDFRLLIELFHCN